MSMYDEAEYQNVGDVAPQGGARQDERLVFYSKEAKEGAITLGSNTVALLPPFPHYEKRYEQIYNEAKEAGKPFKLPVGHFFRQLTVGVAGRTGGRANYRNYRFKEDNHITDAFRALHEAKGFGKMDDEMKKLQRDMGGYGDWRFMVNVLLASSPTMVRVMNISSNNPKDGDDQRKKLASHYVDLVRSFFGMFPLSADMGGNEVQLAKKPLFDPYQNVPLTIDLEYNGDIPQPAHPKLQNQYSHGGKNFVSCISVPDIMQRNGATFSEEMLAYAEEYANTVDDLPDLTDIKGLVENGWACDVLGLSAGAAKATRTQSQGAGFAGGEAPPSSQAADNGFSSAPPTPETPKEEAPKEEAPKAQTGGGFSTFDQKAAGAADAFKAQLDAKKKSSEGAGNNTFTDEKPESAPEGAAGPAGGFNKNSF